MTTGTQISKLADRIEWWIAKPRLKWLMKHKCSIMDNFDENRYDKIKEYTEMKKYAIGWDYFSCLHLEKVRNAKKMLK